MISHPLVISRFHCHCIWKDNWRGYGLWAWVPRYILDQLAFNVNEGYFLWVELIKQYKNAKFDIPCWHFCSFFERCFSCYLDLGFQNMEASLPEPHWFHDFLSSMESKQRRTISFGSLPRTFYDERANFYGVKHASFIELKAVYGTVLRKAQ